jgi:hypothetical protein
MVLSTRKPRDLPQQERPFFERHWPQYLTGAIYREVL